MLCGSVSMCSRFHEASSSQLFTLFEVFYMRQQLPIPESAVTGLIMQISIGDVEPVCL